MTWTVGSGQTPGQLWMADIVSGRTERLLAGQTVTGFDLSPDGRIVASVGDAYSGRLWLARLDGREPPRPLSDTEGDNPRFGANGAIIFHTAGEEALHRIGEDGTGHARIGVVAGQAFGTVSPDGRWISCIDNSGGMSVCSTSGEAPIKIFSGAPTCRLRWNPDGSRLYLSVQAVEQSGFAYGRTYVIPLAKGAVLPNLPQGGYRTEAEIAGIPGVEIVPYGDVAPGPTPETYAFSRTTINRNLYRIPLR